MSRTRTSQAGFTLIELLIASAVFSVILLLVSMGVVQIGRIYYKGITSSYTQEVARTIIEDISETIQISGESVEIPIVANGNVKGFCIGPRRYSHLNNGSLMLRDNPVGGQVKHVMVVDVVDSCNGSTPVQVINTPPLTANSREMLGENMRLANLVITSLPGGFYDITVRVVYGDEDLLCSPSIGGSCATLGTVPASHLAMTDLSCKGVAGSQFCSVSELTTTVQRRIQ